MTSDKRLMRVTIEGESFQLLPERCAFREKDSTLLAADLHFGKPEIFQRHGIAISSQVLTDDLKRLTLAIEKTQARRLVVLGDLIHAPSGLTAEVIETVARWRESHGVEIDVIRGNHDRIKDLPHEWQMRFHDDSLREPPFLYAHEPPEEHDLHCWSGHLHPVVDMYGRGDRIRLPCFAIGKHASVLPAFSAFTGGYDLWRKRGSYRLFPIADDVVIEV